MSDEAGTQYDLAAATDLATVTVREQPQAPEVIAGTPATDPDNDTVYEDVNGDNDVTPGDATVLFTAVFEGNEAVTANPERFDLNGDGEVTPGDAALLFNEAFGGCAPPAVRPAVVTVPVPAIAVVCTVHSG